MWYEKLSSTDKQLGMIYTPGETIFRVWSPLKEQIQLLLYPHPYSIGRTSYLMVKHDDGVHEVTIEGDLKGYFYTFLIDGNTEVTDPYGVASSLNSIRTAVVDLKASNPPGWDNHSIPKDNNGVDAIIYEVHVKDFTSSETSGVKKRGKYLGFVEEDTKYNNTSTGLAHLKELGVTHIHLMPVFDFLTVNEDHNYFFKETNYNWGYDPELYNVPEGSYATRPDLPINRILELKTMIKTLHESGFKVILDVVYNHTFRSTDSNLNMLMPGYYYRSREDGQFSNGTGCGNEIATERPMVRKFIIDSLKYWVNEYKVDGFRFDLMALIDIDTMEQITTNLRKLNPNIFIYGEPWASGITTLPYTKTTTKGTQGKLSFALFNDNFRDAIKGDNDGNSKGFSQGNLEDKIATETGIAGSIYYDDSHIGFAMNPKESINYVNSHDNLILADKIQMVHPSIDDEGLKRLNKFAFSILFTSQGVPFIHAGNEFLRTKNMVRNSYNAPLEINAIDWSLKEKNIDYFNYFKDLITLRKRYKAFRMDNVEEVKTKLKFMEHPGACTLIAYTIALEDNKYLLVVNNGNPHNCLITRHEVKEHLKSVYGYQNSNIMINRLLTEDGLLDETIEYKDPHGIEIPYFCTVIYEIK